MVVEIGRREIFDIRAQLMAEDEPDNEQLISSLEAGDIQPWFYEGGFKTWECALDLARYVLSHRKDILFNADRDEIHVLEV
jgi:protein-histidine N-methyltransferase